MTDLVPETAIVPAITLRHAHDPVRNEIGMFDQVGAVTDHSGYTASIPMSL